MSKINKAWHLKNKMPFNATAKEKLHWHLNHAKNCTCRKLTMDYLEKLKAAAGEKINQMKNPSFEALAKKDGF